MIAWWEKLPRTLQAWLTVGSILLAAASGAFALGAMSSKSVEVTRQLPGRMDNVEAKAFEQDVRLDGHDSELVALHAVDAQAEAQYKRLVCLLLLPEPLSALEQEKRCP